MSQDETEDETTKPSEPSEPVDAGETSSARSLAAVHGALRGRVHVADDFDELPDDIADAFGARDDALS